MCLRVPSVWILLSLLALPGLALDGKDDSHDHGYVHCPITTDSPRAQDLFDRGLSLSYGFNHSEAAQAFRDATAADPRCALCYWGVALVLGPNINAPMDPSHHGEVRQAMAKAQELAPQASAREQALIAALAERYNTEDPQPVTDRAPLDRAYAKAMRRVAQRFPDDLDIATLFAESLMDTTPWDYWTESAEPRAITREFLGVLESVLKRDPAHPGASHLLIHAVEEVRPDLGVRAAESLAGASQATGHLIHMASHIYIRVGRYDDAVEVNRRAIAADDAYLAGKNHGGDYAVSYAPHNHHMLWAAATFAGRRQLALETARTMASRVDTRLMRTSGYSTLQHFLVTPLYALTRFGEWDRILAEPEPDQDLIYPRGVWHYARGMAFVRRGKLDDAARELERLRVLAQDPALESITVWDLNGTASLLAIAVEVLAGEHAAAGGNSELAIGHLRKAVRLQDELTYDEPPPWHYPVRQSLGAALLAAGRPTQAEAVYRQDLDTFPRNGWSLFGLAQALEAQGEEKEAEAVRRQFQEAWKGSDVKLEASRL